MSDVQIFSALGRVYIMRNVIPLRALLPPCTAHGTTLAVVYNN